ncbi:MAG TPA: nuclear transport factor 2 family protein [Chitinophagaceae bacterium]|nr:nuclear transport factor 2 family protein [Chitinophagaceae bacterium]
MTNSSIACSLPLLSLMSACISNNEKDKNINASTLPVPLYDTILNLDSAFFGAFNRKDIEGVKRYLSEDLEFYHDQGGVTNYEQNINAFEKTFQSERKVRRELIRTSFEVSPIKDYGAVELGEHFFYATEKGADEKLSSKAKFVHLWQKKNGAWKITRIISYAHLENVSKTK